MSDQSSEVPETTAVALDRMQFPALDTMRAVGSVAVVLTHCAFWAGAYTQHGPFGPLLARMDVGVAIFFVLSGFLLARPWLVAGLTDTAVPSVRRYFWKRFLRIVPVYVVTAVIALSFIEENRTLTPGDWLVTLGMGDIYLRPALPAGLTQMWSLATEVAFYIVLPLLMLVMLGRSPRLTRWRTSVVLLAMFVISVTWLGALGAHVPGAADRPVNEWLPAFLSWFAVGIGLAVLQLRVETVGLRGRAARVHRMMASSPGVCWLLALSLLLVASTNLAGPTLLVAPTDSEAVTKNLIYAVIGGLLVFSGVFTSQRSLYGRVMSARWLRHLGHISYGIFCIHLPILHLVMWSTGFPLFGGRLIEIFLLTLALSILAAELIYRFIELPSMRLRNLGRSKRPEATTTTAAKDTTTR